jgi:hypothetical protein
MALAMLPQGRRTTTKFGFMAPTLSPRKSTAAVSSKFKPCGVCNAFSITSLGYTETSAGSGSTGLRRSRGRERWIDRKRRGGCGPSFFFAVMLPLLHRPLQLFLVIGQ